MAVTTIAGTDGKAVFGANWSSLLGEIDTAVEADGEVVVSARFANVAPATEKVQRSVVFTPGSDCVVVGYALHWHYEAGGVGTKNGNLYLESADKVYADAAGTDPSPWPNQDGVVQLVSVSSTSNNQQSSADLSADTSAIRLARGRRYRLVFEVPAAALTLTFVNASISLRTWRSE